MKRFDPVRGYHPGDRVEIRGFKTYDGYVPPIGGSILKVFIHDSSERTAWVNCDDGMTRNVSFSQIQPETERHVRK